ncbi:MAG: hypothetical protein ACOCYV_00975 [Planctomycetota bacterium]
MEVFILAAQARILLWVGVGWIVLGLYLGQDPIHVVWRATLGAVLAMIAAGVLMRLGARAIAAQVVGAADADDGPDGAQAP